MYESNGAPNGQGCLVCWSGNGALPRYRGVGREKANNNDKPPPIPPSALLLSRRIRRFAVRVGFRRRFWKIYAWYDNEWGYSKRMAELTCKVARTFFS